jgi:molybdopterin-guanine dinucleotide biosynthesis protein MobB
MKTFRYRGVPVIGFAAYSGSGKTTLMRKLIPCLIARGKRTAIVKHAHHTFDIDHPGKDSYELRKAGATQVIVGSSERWAMVVETTSGGDPTLTDFLQHLVTADIDLIMVEGFRWLSFPKIEVHRKSRDRSLFYPDDDFIIAIVSDDVATHETVLPVIKLDEVDALADFLIGYCAAAGDG